MLDLSSQVLKSKATQSCNQALIELTRTGGIISRLAPMKNNSRTSLVFAIVTFGCTSGMAQSVTTLHINEVESNGGSAGDLGSGPLEG